MPDSLTGAGRKVIISWGGAAGSVLSSCGNAAQAQAMYQSVYNAYPNIAGQDFDIEGGVNLAVLAPALAGLKAANPGKSVSLTLPVLPTGLVPAGLNIVDARITPTGTITFSTNGQGEFSTGTCTLQGSGASAQCSVAYTPAAGGTGTHTVGAAYSGDATHAITSGNTPLRVGLRSASTVNKCSPTYVPLEKPATCEVTVADSSAAGTASTPTGTVTFALDPLSANQKGTFSDGGTCTLQGSGASAVCSVQYTPTAVGGLHEIVAVYSGDKAHAGGPSFSRGIVRHRHRRGGRVEHVRRFARDDARERPGGPPGRDARAQRDPRPFRR